MIAFISGHLDLTSEEFDTHYVPLIQIAIKNNHTFVIGDARGADNMAQQFISEIYGGDNKTNWGTYSPVLVFHMFGSPRNNVGGFKTKGGYKSDDERDAAMTAASDYDIAWVRPGREKSGTAKNLARRKYVGENDQL
jgi:hypothetical protein